MKLRIVQIDVEAEVGADVSELIRAATTGKDGWSGSPSLAPADAPSPAQLPALAPLADAPPVHRGRPKKALAAKCEPASTIPALRQAPGGGDSTAQLILNALAKKPLSSLELRDLLKVEPQKIYAANNSLKTKGLIESRNDENDGTRRWCLK